MKEINFRIFNKKTGFIEKIRSIDFFGIEIQINEARKIKCNNLGNGNIGSENKDFILMQFTGFLDKNGKEIYEGDILENNFFGILGYVVYDSEKGAYQIVDDKLKTSNYFTNFDDLKLIGNIYENEDLIDKFKINEN